MKYKLFLFVSFLLCLLSCTKRTEVDNIETITVNYNARKCNYAWVDNVKSELVNIGNVSGYIRTPLKENSNVKILQYTLAMNTCNVDVIDFPSEYRDYFNSERYNPLKLCPFMGLAEFQKNYKIDERDPTIESKIHQHLIRSNPKLSFNEPQAIHAFVDYRTETITGLKIICSETIFGVEAGNSLNDYFEIVGYPEYHNFIITANKQIITSKIQGISIEQYLSYMPLAPSAIYFQIKKGNINDIKKVNFTINIEINGFKKISATTHNITLEP